MGFDNSSPFVQILLYLLYIVAIIGPILFILFIMRMIWKLRKTETAYLKDKQDESEEFVRDNVEE